MIAVSAVMLMLGAVSCSTERRAERLIDKGDRIDAKVLPRKCSERFPPINGKDSIYIYKQGEPIVIQDTVTLFDTVTNQVTKYITRNTSTIDTVYRQVRITEVDRAKETALALTLDDVKKELIEVKNENKYLLWGLVILGLYTIIRWLVRIIWGFKLP